MEVTPVSAYLLTQACLGNVEYQLTSTPLTFISNNQRLTYLEIFFTKKPVIEHNLSFKHTSQIELLRSSATR